MPMNRISASVLLPTGIACGGSAWPRHRASRTLAVWGRASFARPHQRPLFAPWVGLRAGEAAEGSPPDWRYRGPAPLGQGHRNRTDVVAMLPSWGTLLGWLRQHGVVAVVGEGACWGERLLPRR